MKILMTTDTIGGIWNYALELSEALMCHGAEVTLAAMGAPISPHQRAEAEAIGVTVYESAFKLEWMHEPWEDVRRAGEWLLDLHRLVRADLVHLNNYAHASLPWSAPTVVVAHSCVLSWWRAVHGEDAPDDWQRYRREVRWALRNADLVVTPSHAMLAALRSCYGWVERAQVIPNGRGGTMFTPAPKEPFIFTAGRMWDRAKNLAALEQVAPRLDWPICVAGDWRREGDAVATRGATGGIRYLGRLNTPDLAQWMRRAEIYALPARYEPFGLSALEAALCGCALVLGDIPSLREIWQDNAIFVPPDDTAALQRTINALIADPARRCDMASRARQRAVRFTPQRMARQYLDVYHQLIYRHRASFNPGRAVERLRGSTSVPGV